MYGPGLTYPYVSLVEALRGIHASDALHNFRPFPSPRYSTINPTKPFPGTITARNCLEIYFDGSRPFTKRELARIQSFSDSHIFRNTYTRRQSRSLIP